MTPKSAPSRILQSCEQQKAALAAFGHYAFHADNQGALLHEATMRAAEGLGIGRAKILELMDGGSRLLIRAGIGWDPDVVGKVTLDTNLKSAGGYALHTKGPVISENLDREARFEVPEVLRRHGIKSMVNVIIAGRSGPFGILEVDSAKPRKFTNNDINFLLSYANFISGALERMRSLEELHTMAEELRATAQEKDLLLRELHHRVRNNLQSIISLIRIQRNKAHTSEARQHLEAIINRIRTFLLVHDKLHSTDGIGKLDFGIYLRDLCAGLLSFHGTAADNIQLDLRLADLSLDGETALPLGLIANEFITNSLKYAFPEHRGTITIMLERLNDRGRLVLADNGIGLPDQPKPTGSGLGFQIIPMLASQAQAGMEWDTINGTRLTLTFPIV